MRWQFGSAVRQDSVVAMETAWRGLADASDLPTTQYEWAISALNQVGQDLRVHVAYVSDGATVRGILPMLVSMRAGIEHFQFMSPNIGMPIDIPCTDRVALEQLLHSTIRLGRPIVLKGLLEQSPAAEMLKGMVGERRATIRIERAAPVMYLPLTGFTLQDKFQSAARVSILATSYGLSGGPNDVLFQFVSPSLEQVMQLFHESMQLQVADSPANGRRMIRQDLDMSEFLRSHAHNSAQRGEVRFSCLRLAGACWQCRCSR